MKLLTTLVLSGFCMVLPAAAWAHAVLKSSSPAADAALAKAPGEVVLNFNEKLESAFSNIKLTDASGKELQKAKAKLDPERPDILRLELPELGAGSYSVNWTVVGRDGHRRQGSYRFTVK